MHIGRPGSNGRVPGWILLIPRVYVGFVFALAGIGQLTRSSAWVSAGQSWPAALSAQITGWLPQTVAWYRPISTQLLLPHADTLAPILAAVHVGLGLALIAGVWTRYVVVVAIVLLLNYSAAAGYRLYGAGDAPAYLALLITVGLGQSQVWKPGAAFDHPRARPDIRTV